MWQWLAKDENTTQFGKETEQGGKVIFGEK